METKIVEYLRDVYDAKSEENIRRDLNISSDDNEFYEAFLKLQKDLVIYQTKSGRYMLFENCRNFRKGIMDLNRQGFGFVKIGNGEADIHIPYDKLNGALDGDEVLIEIIGGNKDNKKTEGKVLRVVSRDLKNIVGSIAKTKHGIVFMPNKKINAKLNFVDDSLNNCVEGEIVVATVLNENPVGTFNVTVSNHLCHKDDPDEAILMIAAEHDIFAPFPPEVMSELDKIPNELEPNDYLNKVDHTEDMIFTIDGKDTKDIDDAISLTMDGDNYILGVHIADVSHYVTEDSALDKEAFVRGNSSYLGFSVIPMLPHKLSNGICSLNPEVDRRSMSCIMTINSEGKIIDSHVEESVIRSKMKMNYDDVNEILENNHIPLGYEPYAETLLKMQELAHKLRENRIKRGATEFGSSESKFYYEDYKPVKVEDRMQREGEKLIEDFMIAANESVALEFISNELSSIYRVHENPLPEKIEQFIKVCEILGHPIKGKFKDINPRMFQKLLSQLDDLPDKTKEVVNERAIRSMAKAIYSPENIGHFGLASMNYTHFTSPIRRYSDLIVHRLLRLYFFSELTYEERLDISEKYQSLLDNIASHVSETEVNSQEAERDTDKMMMAEYMEGHVGEEFNAIISGVVKKGLFVRLDNSVEGLVSYDTIEDDYYAPDEYQIFAIGENSSKMLIIGDEVKVKCVAASKENKQIDFILLEVLKYSNQGK